jgi:ABC-2 type transport system permease protein
LFHEGAVEIDYLATWMTRTLRALPTLLKVGFSEAVAYRAEFLVWILSTNMPLVMLALWTAVARDAPVGRFGQREFVAYYLAALVVRQLTGAWVVWELNHEIRHGTLAFKLLRPIHPLVGYACQNVAALPVRLVIAVPVALVLLFTAAGGNVTRDPVLLALFPVTVFAAWLISFLAMSIIGALAFWFESATSLFDVWFGLFGIFAGYLVPLELYPAWVAAAARWLPFRYMLAFPVELVTGTLSRGEVARELAVQWAFVALLLVATRLAWRAGVRRFSSVGG